MTRIVGTLVTRLDIGVQFVSVTQVFFDAARGLTGLGRSLLRLAAKAVGFRFGLDCSGLSLG